MDKATVESVMALAFELARIREEHGAQSGMYLSEVRALRAEVERLAAQAAPTEPTVPLAKSRVGRVYLAGPMTGYENFNFSAFNAAAQRLRAEGFDVVNPADHGIVDGAEWADYLRFDLGKLAQCESIALLPGWEVSKGANLEVSVAQKLGIVVRCLDGAAQPSQAPVVQAMKATSEPLQRYTLRRPKDAADYMAKDSDGQWVKYDDLKADRASSGAATQAVRMLTEDEQAAIIDMHSTGRAQGDHECAEDIQHKFAEVNGLRIPADGKIGSAA